MQTSRERAVPIAPRPQRNEPEVQQQALDFRTPRDTELSSIEMRNFAVQLPRQQPVLRSEHSTCNQRLAELGQSHATLISTTSDLEAEVRSTRKLALETEAFVRGPHSTAQQTLLRAVLFSNISARNVLSTNHSEISRFYASVCPANSIRQICLRSKPTDCSLFDFRILVQHVMREKNIKCKIMPSNYDALLSSTSSVTSFQIVFDSYADICEALRISPDHRQANVYKERKSKSRDLRCVQILGVDLVRHPTSDSRTGTQIGFYNVALERKILLSRSFPTLNSRHEAEYHVLHQGQTSWTEQSWDHGFEYQLDGHRDMTGFTCNTTFHSFVLAWERIQDSPFPRDASPELIPGSLRSMFPAVVLRTRLLTRSAQAAFENTFNGVSLRQILSSTASQLEHN